MKPVVALEPYLTAALKGDSDTCLSLANEALDAGASIEQVYLELFQAAQYRVGELWASNTITVGTEHRATAATQAVIAALYDRIINTGGHGRRFLVACCGREIHEMGPRMVADFAEMAGWDVCYLGTVRSPEALVEAVRGQNPEVVGISATLGMHLLEVSGYIQALKAALGDRCPRILVGGRAFAQAPGAWRKLGADGCASDARDAVTLLAEIA
jgi:methylmalonyl-CoA mutase cobalamin-binding domain/chain